MQIITNNHWNDFLDGFELPESVHSDFDWMDDIMDGTFIKYRNVFYSLDEFMRNDTAGFGTWHGYKSDSFFSGVLIRISDDGEQYQIATYIS